MSVQPVESLIGMFCVTTGNGPLKILAMGVATTVNLVNDAEK